MRTFRTIADDKLDEQRENLKKPFRVTNPQEIRTATNRSLLSEVWSSPEWKEKVAAFTAGKKCERCGRYEGEPVITKTGTRMTHLTVHHPFRWSYKSIPLYLDFETSMCEVICSACHTMEQRHRDICPDCGGWKIEREPLCEICWMLKYPKARELVKKGRIDQAARQSARAKRNYRKRNPHPCRYHGQNQRCKVRPSFICEHNRRNAPKKCVYFKEKKL